MITAAGNTTAALNTRRACVIISHTLEFFWYEFHISVSLESTFWSLQHILNVLVIAEVVIAKRF